MTKTLYLLALEGQIADLIVTFYAVDEADAEEQSRKLEAEHSAKRRDLRQFPRGFIIVRAQLPGHIEEEEQ
jgi:hypothetical protein